MELQIFISKKGTKVVTASNLHVVLGLSNQHYAANVKKWLSDVYEFRDGIRRPEGMKDYAKRPTQDSLLDDYYLSVELAKMITLNSKSKVKQKFATWLLNLEDKVENAELLTTEQVLSVLELAKVMGLVSCQAACEKQHLKTYEERNGGSPANWWNFRSEVLGYSTGQLKKALQRTGKKASGKSQRQMLMSVDKYEMVRTAVIDMFMALGKPERYAKNLGDLAKVFAKELNVEIFDDRGTSSNFAPPLNPDLAREVKNLKNSRYLQLWETQKMAS
jgi:phage anti-repressor protein